jgi:hypothetical protein
MAQGNCATAFALHTKLMSLPLLEQSSIRFDYWAGVISHLMPVIPE